MNPTDRDQPSRRLLRLRPFRLASIAALALVIAGIGILASPGESHAIEAEGTCGKKYVAGGDHIPAGHEVSQSERYPNHLLDDHLSTYGYCLFNTAQNETTSSKFITGGQLAQTWNLRPDLITLTVGGENTTIVNLITSCFDKVKDHDFAGANACAAAVLANEPAYTSLYNNLITIFQQYRMIMAGRPHLIVAVTGYPNPYPRSTEVLDEIGQLCLGVIDAMISCNVRWAQLPPALLLLDNAIKKLNTTIENAVKPFFIGSEGRFIFVNPYDKFASHVMKMEVTLKLERVCHLCGTKGQYFDDHSKTKNLGSSDPYFVEGPDGTKFPEYLLIPGPLINPPVVIMQVSQKTVGMGIHPNDKGHKCISDLIWEWDTPEPGVTPLKWKLGIAEQPNSNICQ
ncbi:MAG TPA: hypothetical protein VJP78_05595 [Thermoleophilia bacterium]|nr:hypothetical protein [Thermoleophilia bacterium]